MNLFSIFICQSYSEGNPHGVVANVQNCDRVVSEFELKSR